MVRLTRLVLRRRGRVVAAWAAIFAVPAVASSELSGLLTNLFALPVMDTHRAE